jgi:hypothetical protein
MMPNQEPAPILRVTVEASIYSNDGEKLGTVKEIQGNAFKVGTGLFQRDYWLSGDAVESAVPGESVFLKVDKADIDQHKVDAPDQAA